MNFHFRIHSTPTTGAGRSESVSRVTVPFSVISDTVHPKGVGSDGPAYVLRHDSIILTVLGMNWRLLAFLSGVGAILEAGRKTKRGENLTSLTTNIFSKHSTFQGRHHSFSSDQTKISFSRLCSLLESFSGYLVIPVILHQSTLLPSLKAIHRRCRSDYGKHRPHNSLQLKTLGGCRWDGKG